MDGNNVNGVENIIPQQQVPIPEQKPLIQKPQKKSNGWLIAIAIFLFLAILLSAVAYWGYKKFVDGVSSQVELGAEYTSEDYDSMKESLDDLASKTASICFECSPEELAEEPLKVEMSFTSAQIASYIDTEFPEQFSNSQVKFTEGQFEISTLMSMAEGEEKMATYIEGTLEKATATSIDLSVTNLKIGEFYLPVTFAEGLIDGIETEINTKLAEYDGMFEIIELSIKEDMISFSGLVPVRDTSIDIQE